MDDKSNDIVEFKGRLFEVKRMASNVILPVDNNDDMSPIEKGIFNSIVMQQVRDFGFKMLELGLLKIEMGTEFDDETGEIIHHVIQLKSAYILDPIKSDE